MWANLQKTEQLLIITQPDLNDNFKINKFDLIKK